MHNEIKPKLDRASHIQGQIESAKKESAPPPFVTHRILIYLGLTDLPISRLRLVSAKKC